MSEAAHGALIAGRYEVRDRIGQGAHALVLEALDRRLQRLVAVKLLPHRPDELHPELLARFEQEARVVARLSHPGIVPVHDCGDGPDYAWLVMELVIGESLEEALRRLPRIPPPEALRIAAELLDALAAAHGRGVVHRDVKPANILLVEQLEDGLGRVRLTDFGVAHFPEQHGGLTAKGQMIGTLSTMSPEQIRGEAPDPRMDVWAVGAVLYRMLTGRRPFERDSYYATMQAIQGAEPAPASTLVPGLPAQVDALLARALAKYVASRTAGAAEMAQEVRECLHALQDVTIVQ